MICEVEKLTDDSGNLFIYLIIEIISKIIINCTLIINIYQSLAIDHLSNIFCSWNS